MYTANKACWVCYTKRAFLEEIYTLYTGALVATLPRGSSTGRFQN